MTKLDPIIAVKDVEASSKWYQEIFGFRRTHGGNDFAVLVSEDNEIVLALHKWGEHQHPTMTNQNLPIGNGVILYFRTKAMHQIRKNVSNFQDVVEEEIHLNPNSLQMEFSMRDPDGYYLIVSDFHKYEG